MGKLRISDGIDVHYGSITASGGIDGLDLSNGISGTNFNISGVNALTINDPGEGIVFGGGSTTVTLYAIDDSTDSIMNFSNASELRVNNSKVWHAGNDGSGSTLDADLLDGQHGSYYRNASNINAGTLSSGRMPSTPPNTYIYGDDTLGAFASSTFAVNPPRMGFFNINNSSAENPAGFGYWQGLHLRHNNQSSTWGWQLAGTYNTSYSDLYFRQVASASRGSWYKLWHTGNDGSSSGLDADLLDGQHGSHYTNASNISSGTIPSARLPSPLNSLYSNAVTGSAFATTGSPSSVLEYQQAASITDTKLAPTTDWYNSIRMGHGNPYSYYSNTIAMQMTGTGAGKIRTQLISNNNAQGWRTVWDSSTDGSGSGLDADLLDGAQGSSYLRSDQNDTTSGILTTQQVRWGTGSGTYSGNPRSAVIGYSGGNYGQIGYGWHPTSTSGQHTSQINDLQSRIDLYNGIIVYGSGTSQSVGSTVSWTTLLDCRTNSFQYKSNNIWHAGSDGSGSGLDADTLDGQHASAFLTSFTETNSFIGDGGSASTHPGTSRAIYSGQVSAGTSVLGMPTTNNANSFLNLNKHSGEYNSQLGFSSNGKIYYRNFNNTAINSTQAWRTIWDSGTDGSGSGLDADTLDGLNSSSLLRSDADDAYDGTLTMNGMQFRVSNANRNLKLQGTGGGSDCGISGFTSDGSHGYQLYGTNSGYYGFLDANWGSWDIQKVKNGTFKVDEGSGLKRVLNEANWSSYVTNVSGDAGRLLREDNRTISPSELSAGRLKFGFTSWANNNTSPYADFLHLRSYTDSSGGSDNLVMFKKSGIGMRIWQQSFGSGTAYSSYADVWHTGNDGSGSGLDADTLDGYNSAENGGSTIHRLASNGYSQIQNWQNVAGAGLYSSNYNGAHFYPNTGLTTYGTWRVNGTRNGYTGIVYDGGGDVVASMYDSGGNGGDWNGTNGWQWYWHRSNSCLAVAGSTTSSSYSLYVGGAIYATNDVVAYSDRRIKENIVTIDTALEKVNKLRGVYYNRIDDEDKEREIGFIAQEVNEVAPELVTYAEDVDQYGVKYGNTTALLVEAIKELTQQVKDLKQEVEELKNG